MEVKVFYAVLNDLTGIDSYWEKEEDAYKEAFRQAKNYSDNLEISAPVTREELEDELYSFISVEPRFMNCSLEV